MTKWAVALVGCLACGRIDFDPRGAADAPGAEDAAATALCGTPATAPPTVTIGGVTFRYADFDNDPRVVIPDVAVTVRDRATGDLLTDTQSNLDGFYSVTVPTGGVPRRISLRYEVGGYVPTTVYTDLGVHEDTMGTYVPLWQLGDAPLWTAAAVMNVYDAVTPPVPVRVDRGTLNVAVRDCAGAPVEGVTVAIDPQPEVVRYQGATGSPSDVGMTTGPFGHVIGFNAPPGAIRVTTMAGVTRQSELSVTVGEVSLGVIRAID